MNSGTGDEQQYVRLSAGSPQGSPKGSTSQQTRGFFFPDLQYGHEGQQQNAGLDSEDELVQPKAPWWRLTTRSKPPAAAHTHTAPEQSAYLTLIPLSDSRLRPARTNLIVGILLTLAAVAVSAVYVLVPRGVTVGPIRVHSSQISFNTSKSTYQILLTASIPVYNPNYLPVLLSGVMNVSFYDQQAGTTRVQPVRVLAGAQPQMVHVGLDASSVPQKYLFTIYTQCFTFPEKLIFFLTASLQVEYLGSTFPLPLIDNYFIISCNQSGEDDKGGGSGGHHHNANALAPGQAALQPALSEAAAVEGQLQREASLPHQLLQHLHLLRQRLTAAAG